MLSHHHRIRHVKQFDPNNAGGNSVVLILLLNNNNNIFNYLT
jgi:hypothetical protein